MSKARETKGPDANVASGKRQADRKPYTRPLFERLGGLREITHGGSAGTGESGTPRKAFKTRG